MAILSILPCTVMALRWAENGKCTRLQIQKNKKNIRACRTHKRVCKLRMHNFRMSFLMHTLMYWFISWKKHSLPFWNSLFTCPSPLLRTHRDVRVDACVRVPVPVHPLWASPARWPYFIFFLYFNLNIIMLLFYERYYKITCLQLHLLNGYTFCVTWAKKGI